MAQHGLAFLLAIIVWWLSTALIIVLCALPRRTFGWSFAAASSIAMAAIYGFARSAWSVDVAGTYFAFLSALAIWGWIEMSFLMGFITGPRTGPCPEGARGWVRFGLALQTLLYHELTIAGAAVLLVAMSWNAPNQTGTSAFLILTAMRVSAKMNIFLGVPYLTDEFLPKRLDYLKSYFRKRRTNALFPLSVGLSALAAILLVQKAMVAEAAQAGGYVLLFALTALAILEHIFMIAPLPDAVLWRWMMPAKPIDKQLP